MWLMQCGHVFHNQWFMWPSQLFSVGPSLDQTIFDIAQKEKWKCCETRMRL